MPELIPLVVSMYESEIKSNEELALSNFNGDIDERAACIIRS